MFLYERIRREEGTMDEMKLNLTSKFMKGIVTKILAKVIKKQLGYDVDIELNDIHVIDKDGKVHLHADIDAEMANDQFKELVKDLV
jgi:hypothetical protein